MLFLIGYVLFLNTFSKEYLEITLSVLSSEMFFIFYYPKYKYPSVCEFEVNRTQYTLIGTQPQFHYIGNG